jgi:hypothetical protein
MTVVRVSLCLAVLVALSRGAPPSVAVVSGSGAPALEQYAARELCRYLSVIFHIRVEPVDTAPAGAGVVFLIGSPATNPAIDPGVFPKVGPQGIVLRPARVGGKPAFIVGGGTPAATLWAVSELAERWGVRHLLHEDIYPSGALPFALPSWSAVMEPALPVRAWRVVNDFACGPESWGMADYRPVFDQLARLKFNRILISVYPWQPFLDFAVKGVRRTWATLWYGYHYPITADMPGRGLFGNAAEFWNPDLPRGAGYREFAGAGEQLIHNLIAYSHTRGMEVALTATLTEFPPEFAAVLKSSRKIHQLAELDIVPGPDTRIEDPELTTLASAVLRATVNTYPEADYVALGMPEHRDWVGQYEHAWNALDARYRISRIRSLADVLSSAERRTGYPGGAERAVREVKGDLAILYFFDRLRNELHALEGTRRPDMKFIYGHIAEELYPFLARILPPGSETMNFVDYTPARIVRRREVLRSIPGRDVPSTLIYTLHDDNIGLLPQLMTGSLASLTDDLRRYGWAGFVTRYWLTGDHDTLIAYLSRAAWDRGADARIIARDQIRSACGEGCVKDLSAALADVEYVTSALEWHALGLTFPVPGMIMKHWKPEKMPRELLEDRRGYQNALEAGRRARSKATNRGAAYADYWAGRLEFATGYLDCVEEVHQAAAAEASGKRVEALHHAVRARDLARAAIEAYARVARDQSDRGAIATLNEYVYRPLQAKLLELR